MVNYFGLFFHFTFESLKFDSYFKKKVWFNAQFWQEYIPLRSSFVYMDPKTYWIHDRNFFFSHLWIIAYCSDFKRSWQIKTKLSTQSIQHGTMVTLLTLSCSKTLINLYKVQMSRAMHNTFHSHNFTGDCKNELV